MNSIRSVHILYRTRSTPFALARYGLRDFPEQQIRSCEQLSGTPRVPTCACASVRVGTSARAQAAALASMSSRV